MHAKAAALKREIEATLASRMPAALSPVPHQAARLLPVGNAALDTLLHGGLPLGSICEVIGPPGSGQTSIALSLLASAATESACAYVDVSDTLVPRSAAATGVLLNNILWVRFGADGDRLATPPPLDPGRAGAFAGLQTHSPTPIHSPTPLHGSMHSGCGTSHPRGETRDLAPALEQMLFDKGERRERKQEGTPGHRNQPLGLHTASQDQVEWERFNLRRIDETDPLRQMDQFAAEQARKRALTEAPRSVAPARQETSWNRLSHALRATDQVLQSSGFRIVVLDLASIPAQQALRIPSATWFRFRRAAQESGTILLLLTQGPCARSSAACVLQCSPGQSFQVQGVLSSASRTVAVAQQRTAASLGKKAPGRATNWTAEPAHMRPGSR